MTDSEILSYVKSAPCDLVWGRDDCTMWCVKWLERKSGRDLEMPSYRTREESDALICEAGSLVDLWEKWASRNGLRKTMYPMDGDICVISMRGHEVGCIYDTPYSWWRADKGVIPITVRDKMILGCWSI